MPCSFEVMKEGLANPITMTFHLTANASELHLMTSNIKIIFSTHTDTHMYFCKLLEELVVKEVR